MGAEAKGNGGEYLLKDYGFAVCEGFVFIVET